MKVVLDTNLFISGIILKKGNPYKILEAWKKDYFILLISKPIFQEIERTLRYPKIYKKYHITEEEIREALNVLLNESIIIDVNIEVTALRDLDDNKFLACAKEGSADFIVSGDREIQDLKEFEGISIFSPAEFVRYLGI